MDSSIRGTASADAWRRWDRHNVAVDDDGVTIATDELPTYERGRPAAVPTDAAIVDVATAPCGDPYVLTADGELFRYDPDRESAERLSCVWQATGEPRALCVTADSIYVAGDGPGAVQAISRVAGQTRWIADRGVNAPVALARCAGGVYLLAGASHRETASIRLVRPDGTLRPVVTGLMAPRDFAAGPADRLWVLDVLVGTEPSAPGEGEPVVRRFEAADLTPGAPVDATDSVHVAPSGFRILGTGEPVPPVRLAVGTAGDLLVGVHPDWNRQHALLRYRPTAAAFERQPAFEAGCRALAAPNRADAPRAYAVDAEDGRLFVLDGGYRVRRDDAGATAGRLVTRFDAGEVGTRWHRVALERTLPGSESEVRVRYAATDADRPAPATGDEWDAPPLETVSGIGETYAARLREWGVADLAGLAALSPAAVQSIVSVEELDVAAATVADWQAAAEALLAGGEPEDADVEAVDGVGPTYGARLRAGGVPDLATLVEADPEAVRRIVSAGTLDVSLSRAEAWVAEARDRRPERPGYDGLDWSAIAPSSPRDALLTGAEGRYLWVALELVGTTRDAPTVETFQAEFPRETYLSELPAIYREDPDSAAFLERYLSLFERVFSDVEAAVEALASYLDPWGIPAEGDHLAWLGEWLAMDVDGAWPEPVAREFVDRAPELYRMRGTRRGLRTALSIYLEHAAPPTPDWERARTREAAHLARLAADGLLTEREAAAAREAHAELAEREPAPTVTMLSWADLACAEPGEARAFYERLVGCPAGFLVLLHPRVGDADVRALSRIVAGQTPAHASGRTVGLRRRVQLSGTRPDGEPAERGYHTYLGVNAVLSEKTFALESAGLGEETVLGSHEPDGRFDLQARLGEDARIS